MTHPDTRAAYLEAVFGDGAWEISKADKKKSGLSNADKTLVASNAISAGIGIGTLNQLRKPVKANSERSLPRNQQGGLPRAGARGLRQATRGMRKSPNKVLRALGRAGAKPEWAMNKFGGKRVGAALVGAGLIGGAAFNTAADAASAISIANKDKKKISKGVGLELVKVGTNPDIRNNIRARKGHITRRQNADNVVKSDFTMTATVSKAVEDKRQVYGWASVTELNGEPVLDLQGDYVTIEEIEKAAHAYIASSRKGGDMHRRNGDDPHHVADLIESVIISPEKKEALGISKSAPTGWWVGFQVNDEETWQLVKDGKRPMFSIHGSGTREDMELPIGKALMPKLPKPVVPNTGALKPKLPKPPVAPKPAQGATQQRILRPVTPRRTA